METKPGYLTTEFWVSIFTAGYLFLNTTGLLDQVSNKWSAICMAAIGGLYTVSRGVAKSGVKPDLS